MEDQNWRGESASAAAALLPRGDARFAGSGDDYHHDLNGMQMLSFALRERRTSNNMPDKRRSWPTPEPIKRPDRSESQAAPSFDDFPPSRNTVLSKPRLEGVNVRYRTNVGIYWKVRVTPRVTATDSANSKAKSCLNVF